MEPKENDGDDQNEPRMIAGKGALLACLSLLQDLEVQIADDPSRMEDMAQSLVRRGHLLPIYVVDSRIDRVSLKAITEMMRLKRMKRRKRIHQAQQIIQEIIRDFEKSEASKLDDFVEPDVTPEAP